MEELSVREADIYDTFDILEVMQSVGYSAYSSNPMEARERIIGELIINKPVQTFVLPVPANRFRNERVVGYSVLSPAWREELSLPEQFNRDGYAYSKRLDVHSEFQRKGVGYALAAYTIQKAQEAGYRGIYSDVASDNNPSLELQKKMELQEIARVRHIKRGLSILSVWFVKKF